MREKLLNLKKSIDDSKKKKKLIGIVAFFIVVLFASIYLISYSHYVNDSSNSIMDGVVKVGYGDVTLRVFIQDRDANGDPIDNKYRKVGFIPQSEYSYDSTKTKCTDGVTIDNNYDGNLKILATKNGSCDVYYDAQNSSIIKSSPDVTVKIMAEQTKGKGDYVEVYGLPKDNYYAVNKEKTSSSCSNASILVRTIDVGLTSNTDCVIYADIIELPTLSTYLMNDVYNNAENQASIATNQAGLYFHNDALTNGAQDNVYRYAGGYNFPKASEGYDSYSKIIKDITVGNTTLLNCTLAYDKTNKSYSLEEAVNRAIGDGYFEEAVNNYACFEGDDCSVEDNLYRIISVDSSTNQTKVIKVTTVGNMTWNDKAGYTAKATDVDKGLTEGKVYRNIWGIPDVYKSEVNENLNKWYLEDLENKTKRIVNTEWNIGGYELNWAKKTTDVGYESYDAGYNAKQVYDLEKGNASKMKAYDKIGLMYVHEYMYAALPEFWPITSNSYPGEESYASSIGKDWMISPWHSSKTITRRSDSNDFVYAIKYDGSVIDIAANAFYTNYTRPTFNLSSDTRIANSGTENLGSRENPIIIS